MGCGDPNPNSEENYKNFNNSIDSQAMFSVTQTEEYMPPDGIHSFKGLKQVMECGFMSPRCSGCLKSGGKWYEEKNSDGLYCDCPANTFWSVQQRCKPQEEKPLYNCRNYANKHTKELCEACENAGDEWTFGVEKPVCKRHLQQLRYSTECHDLYVNKWSNREKAFDLKNECDSCVSTHGYWAFQGTEIDYKPSCVCPTGYTFSTVVNKCEMVEKTNVVQVITNAILNNYGIPHTFNATYVSPVFSITQDSDIMQYLETSDQCGATYGIDIFNKGLCVQCTNSEGLWDPQTTECVCGGTRTVNLVGTCVEEQQNNETVEVANEDTQTVIGVENNADLTAVANENGGVTNEDNSGAIAETLDNVKAELGTIFNRDQSVEINIITVEGGVEESEIVELEEGVESRSKENE